MKEKNLDSNPYYLAALRFIAENDLNSLANGKHVIDGDNVYLKIVDSELRPAEKARLEVHDEYIDIQVPLSGAETYGIKPRKDCTLPVGEMDREKDIMFFSDKICETVTVEAGNTVTFAPDTAHAPLIGEGVIHKAIFKVKAV